MLVPLKWLNDYVKVDDIDPKVYDDSMTMSGSKVEEVIETGKEIANVVTGRLTKIEKHPDADKLLICQVDVGNETIQIVTGANNVHEGDVVPVALHGSSLPGGVKIKKGKLRGVESNGMLCSAVELGMDDEDAVHGILILPGDTPIGADAKEVLGLNSVIVDFEITPNRSDCLSMIGMARETAVTFDRELHLPEIVVHENDEDINDYIDIEIKAEDLCRRYTARVVKDVKIGSSPEWMKERLLEAGVRPINNIVDITNYVMLEWGQPLHAFDYDKIAGKKIIVRRAEDGEKLATLDGKERNLNSSMLVIADAHKALAVAGVMGGENSEVTENTKTILFESANFNGTSVRLTSKELGFRTEASARFEKGIDPNITVDAVNRAVQLATELGAGEVVSGIADRYKNKLEPWTIDISPVRINKFLGTDVPTEEMVKILEKLGVRVIGGDYLKALIPTFRGDLELEVDIAEEIARIYGYNNIESSLIRGVTLQGVKTREHKIGEMARELLVGAGLFEIQTYSFLSPSTFDTINTPEDSALRNTVRIMNPLGEEFSVMRTTLMPEMLEVLNRNYNTKAQGAQFFEIGRVYRPRIGEKLPEEKNILSIGMYGKHDFLDIKGVVELLLDSLGVRKYEFIRESGSSAFHPGKTAALIIKKKNAGCIGEIHPDIAEKYGLPSGTYLCELDFDEITSNSELERHFRQLPKYPAVERDMALIVSRDTMISEIESIISSKGGSLVERVKLFDVYEGKQVPEGKKSVAYSITYRAGDRTLTDDEVSKVHDEIIKAAEKSIGAQLRL